MVKVVIAGGGWAGCAAALAAAKAGAAVTVRERTDMLLGTGLVGGIFRNNGRFTAAEEAIAMGGGDLFQAMDRTARHANIDFPGHRHASLYDVIKMEPVVRKVLADQGVTVKLQSRVVDCLMSGKTVKGLVTDDGAVFRGDVYVDATGTFGPMGNCIRYGNGCAMCILRCPSFGPRVSITARAGIKELIGRKTDGSYGAMSGSCKVNKDSLDAPIREQLEKTGVVVIPVPPHMIKPNALGRKACSQYAVEEYMTNVVLLDTGHAKLMASYYPVEELRRLPGLQNARFEDPYGGGQGNSVRYMGMAPRDNHLKVHVLDNVFCAGEKSGIIVGHTEAIVTGLLAGHNAVRYALGKPLLELPRNLACGDFIAFVNERMETEEGLKVRCTFSGAVYFEQMREKGLYTTDVDQIAQRVAKAGLTNVYAERM